MKTLALLILLVTPLVSFSQNFDKNKEKAYFAVNHQGGTAYITTVKSMDGDFTKENLATLEGIMSEKDGIFEITRIENAYITISHLSEIDNDTLKGFLLMVKSDIEFVEIEEYTIQ
ncbi:MAG: hypothetical protein ACI837_001228 [Crocinitomicaceae bacterium]|jgi:hypothetical protein